MTPRSAIIPVPVTEAKDLSSEWLSKEGFVAFYTVLQDGSVNCVANRDKILFSFDLLPSSALATRMVWHKTPFERYLTDLLDHLKHLRFKGPGQAPLIQKHFTPFAVEKKKESIVCIYSEVAHRTVQLTGFVIQPKGFIVSTAHSLSLNQSVEVFFKNGRSMMGRVVKIDFHLDLTLIDVKKSLDNSISVDNGRQFLDIGDLLFAIGCPEDVPRTLISGYVNKPLRRSKNLPLIEVRMDIDPGSSGSPVFDINGNMVGIIKGRYRGTDHLGFLIPFETLKRFLTID